MADISYHLDRGAELVIEGTGASTQDIELIVDNAESVTKKDVLLALTRFQHSIQNDDRFAEV